MSIATTLRDISKESALNNGEKISLRRIAKEFDSLQAENKQQADFLSLAKEEMDTLQAKLEAANHDYAELMKERADYVAENKRLRDAMNDELKSRVITTLEWMITHMKYRADDLRQNVEEGSQGGYSPELTEAINLLAELKTARM